jgi:acetoin utilization protein AcuB
MLVQDWMSSKVITVDDDASIMKASNLMKQNGIQHLPVLKEERLIGIISDRDLKEAQPLFTITLEETVEKAAAIMLKHNISALPVVNPEGGLAGIIAKGDVFRAFVSISGIQQAALQIGFQLEDWKTSLVPSGKLPASSGPTVAVL